MVHVTEHDRRLTNNAFCTKGTQIKMRTICDVYMMKISLFTTKHDIFQLNTRHKLQGRIQKILVRMQIELRPCLFFFVGWFICLRINFHVSFYANGYIDMDTLAFVFHIHIIFIQLNLNIEHSTVVCFFITVFNSVVSY